MLCVLIRITSQRVKKTFLNYPLLSPEQPGAMINPQWLELPMSRTNFYGIFFCDL